MGKKITKASMELRRSIRAEIDANPKPDHKKLRSKYKIDQGIIDSAMSKTVADWDALIASSGTAKPKQIPEQNA